MEKQFIKALIEKATDGGNGYSFIASTSAIDRQGDSIDQSGWDLKDYMKNPVMLWAHDYSAPPIARALTIDPTDVRGLVGTCEFAPTDFAQQIKTLIDGGFVSALSVGFIPMERNGNIITKSQLLEISFVPVPANQEALMLAAKAFEAKGFAADALKSFMVPKAACKGVGVCEDGECDHNKGAVSDEIAAEEQYEQKWANLDGFIEIVSAFMDVYLDEQTPPEAFKQLLLEVSSLIAELAQGDDVGDEDAQAQTAALRKLIKSVAGKGDVKAARALILEKMGAKHSSDTKKAITAAADSIDAASVVLRGLLTDEGASTEDDEEVEVEPAVEEDAAKDMVVARALLITRGVLREGTSGDQLALSAINRLLKERA